MATQKIKREAEAEAEEDHVRKMAKVAEGDTATIAVAGPSSSDKLLPGIETAQPLIGDDSGPDADSCNGSTPKKRGAGQKRGRSWNREEEEILMESWNEVARRGLKAKDVTEEVEKVFHEMAIKKWGESRQSTIHALDRKGGSLLARAKGLIRQFADVVTFARAHTTAVNYPNSLTDDELEKLQVEINTKRQAMGTDAFRSWHVRDALIYHHKHFYKQTSGDLPLKNTAKRKSFPQDGIASRQHVDVERQKLELEKQRFKEGQRATTLDSLHKLLSTLHADDETAPVIRQQILKLNTII